MFFSREIFISITTFLFFQIIFSSILVGQEHMNQQAIRDNLTKIAEDEYLTVDTWEDIPLIYIKTLENSTTWNIIYIWGDGRIAWASDKDESFFMAQISSKKASDVLNKMIVSFGKKTPAQREYKCSRRLSTIHSIPVSSAIYSRKLYKNDRWSQTLIGTYKKHQILFKDKEKEKLLESVASYENILNPFNQSSRKIFLGFCSDTYNKDNAFSYDLNEYDNVLCNYVLQFSAECDFFILLESLVVQLVPKDDQIISKRVTRKRKRIHIYQNEEKEFIYVNTKI